MILKQTHIVQELTGPIRLQEYGVGIFQQISTKSALKKALKKNQRLELKDWVKAIRKGTGQRVFDEYGRPQYFQNMTFLYTVKQPSELKNDLSNLQAECQLWYPEDLTHYERGKVGSLRVNNDNVKAAFSLLI